MTSTSENGKTLAEASVALTAITAPLWMQQASTYIGFLMAIGGLVLLILTIVYRSRQIKKLDDRDE